MYTSIIYADDESLARRKASKAENASSLSEAQGSGIENKRIRKRNHRFISSDDEGGEIANQRHRKPCLFY